MTDWHEIWSKRSLSRTHPSKDVSLQDLIFADGFDSGTGRIDVENWVDYIGVISKKMDLAPGDSIFEIGCGSGAFLYLWYKEGHLVGGIDYSGNLISSARRAIPGMNFQVSEAIDVDTKVKFDIVLSNGVFFYFKNYGYARKVVEKMFAKARKTIAILEVPDLARREESEAARRASLPEGEYEKKYEGLAHLYFGRDWFNQFSEDYGCSIEIFDHDIRGYGNSPFRFNVLIKK